MKQHNQEEQIEDEHELEIVKAVAQAWHGHSSNSSSKSTSEFDAHKRNFKSRPTRFKIEALNIASSSSLSLSSSSRNGGGPARWDFGKSLWDSYEIVDVCKKLERGLVLDYSFSVIGEQGRDLKRRKESTRSLRKLFAGNTSERFKEDDIPKG